MSTVARLLLAVAALTAAAGTTAQAAWKENILINFSSDAPTKGYNPRLGVLLNGGAVYGVTTSGGKNGGGTVYRREAGKVTVLFSFTNGDASGCGYNPSSTLVARAGGALFGTTVAGGAGNGGVVFRLAKNSANNWICSALHSFDDGAHAPGGSGPFGGLVMDAGGVLYGTAGSGGTLGGGLVFKLVGTNFTVLHNFSNSGAAAREGFGPSGRLTLDNGTLYGATFFGGASKLGGTIYKLPAAGPKGGPITVLHRFSEKGNAARQGYRPAQGPLLIDSAGNIYGATILGGCPVDADGAPLCPNPNSLPGGVLFKLAKAGGSYTYSVPYRFDSNLQVLNGFAPYGGLIMDGSGALYGVTQSGGSQNGGVAFKLTPSGAYSVLSDFNGPTGFTPNGPLAMDSQGNLIGTTFIGGASNGGVVFQLKHP
jgi:uncharacterized repeat protein (TIGR03803 family)